MRILEPHHVDQIAHLAGRSLEASDFEEVPSLRELPPSAVEIARAIVTASRPLAAMYIQERVAGTPLMTTLRFLEEVVEANRDASAWRERR